MFPIHEMNTTDQVKESSNLLLLVWNLRGQNFERFLITLQTDFLVSRQAVQDSFDRSYICVPLVTAVGIEDFESDCFLKMSNCLISVTLIRQTISDMMISCSKFGMVIAQLHFL